METGRTRYISPDGVLTFLVIRDEQDTSLGFEGFPSHTHGDILAELMNLPLEDAVARYIADLLGNRAIIGTAIIDGVVRDIWITDDPKSHLKYKHDDEVITFRTWDGTQVSPEN
jgi:hypothetical protein